MNVRDLKEWLEDFPDQRTVVVPNSRGSARELAEVKEVELGYTKEGDYGKDPTKVEGDLIWTKTVVALAPTRKPEEGGDK